MCSNHAKVDVDFTSGNYPPGTHMCLVYSSEEERSKIIARFMERGLLAGEKVGYFADTSTPEEIVRWLEGMGVALPTQDESVQLSITSTAETYFPEGNFVPEATFEMLKELYADAYKEHFQAIRITGEMSWALKNIAGTERLMEYESRVNEIYENYPISAICQYDANKFDGATIMECLKVHPYMVVRGQVVRNPYYIRWQEYLKDGISER